jgi:hypothetical protein
MKVAILCSGPSLQAAWAWRKKAYDVIIGVNAAVEFWPTDWWCCGDWEALTWFKRPPAIGICSIGDALRHVQEGTIHTKFPWQHLRMVSWEELPIHWRFSSIMALGLARFLGATAVDYFGDDKDGSIDYTGAVDPHRTDSSRWEDEKQQLAQALVWAREQGFEVNWVKPPA